MFFWLLNKLTYIKKALLYKTIGLLIKHTKAYSTEKPLKYWCPVGNFWISHHFGFGLSLV